MTLLVCPFHHLDENMNTVECGHKSLTDMGYLAHTKKHKPNVLKPEDRLWKKRLRTAQIYADKSEKKRPWMLAAHMWKTKPKDMDCGQMSAMIQDFGVTDTDNYAGLDATTGGSGQGD